MRGADTDGTELDEAGGHPHHATSISIRGFHLEVVGGPALGRDFDSTGDSCSIGSNPANDLPIHDRAVSRFHVEIRIEGTAALLRDLGSTNGTFVDGVPVREAWLREGSLIRIGQSTIAFHSSGRELALRISGRQSFGTLVGHSIAMRSVFEVLERSAAADSTLLLEGETGTGKTQAAEAVHEASGREGGPFVVVDCGGIPKTLLEAELFGYERGAFTGATESRQGAFEAAHEGTLFLDEVGELPPLLQPKLLRFLEHRSVKRIGSNADNPIDVRVIAATNRDLREAVNKGEFREDLYYRLAVIRTRIPPLRHRPEDIPPIAARLLRSLRVEPNRALPFLQPEFLAQLQASSWPGNIRQLRNHLERCVVLGDLNGGNTVMSPDASAAPWVDSNLSFGDAKQRAIERFEKEYLAAALARHGGNVSKTARAAEINRVYLHRLLRRHGLRAPDTSDT
ncbi:MAG: sigma 54-interacting transcriptional regulator [Myxococcota bacterium]